MLHLRNHSVYSYEHSILKLKDIIEIEKRQGENSFCITDIGSLTSFIKAFDLADKYNMKFIPGCEFKVKPDIKVSKIDNNKRIKFLSKEMNLKRTTEEMAKKYEKEIENIKNLNSVTDHRIILIAKNQNGLTNLINIYNEEEKDPEDIFLTTNESIFKNSKDLICLSGGINGEILYYIQNNNLDKAKDLLLQYKNIFKNNFYAEIEINFSKRNKDQYIDTMNKFINLAKDNGIPFVITNDCRYATEEDRLKFRLYRQLMSKDRVFFNIDNNYLITEEELREIMKEYIPKDVIDEGFKNIKKIESQIEDITIFKAEGLKDCSEELLRLCKEGWEKKRKGTIYEQASKERYEYELSVINGRNFSEYFLKILKIITVARELGILIGPGRGSAGGSEICYLIGIHVADPIKYGLFFERFLNPNRHGYPDIDLDMSTVPVKERYINIGGVSYKPTDIITTKNQGVVTAKDIYDLVQKGETVEI